MAGEQGGPPAGTEYPFGPVKLVLGGAATIFAAYLLGIVMPDALVGVRFAVVAVGLAVTGAGLVRHWPHVRWNTADLRVGTSLLLLVAGGASWLSCETLAKYADSMALVARNAALIAFAGALLVAVPTGLRKGLASLAIAFHFGIIIIACAVAPPPAGATPPWNSPQPEIRFGGAPPWLATQIIIRYGQQYLQFLQMYNAYHFYAPEPGPSTLVWFRVVYTDGAVRWVKMPDHPSCPNELARRRFGALATALAMSVPTQLSPEVMKSREKMALRYNPPLHPTQDMPLPQQYREPTPQGKMLVAAYAKYVARTATHPEGGVAGVRGVRAYKLDYHNPPARALANDVAVLDPVLYEAYFMGEFTESGVLVEASRDDLLYWLLPIYRVPPEDEKHKPDRDIVGTGKVINGLRLHAGEADQQETMP